MPESPSTSQQPIVEMRHIEKSFGAVRALRDVDLTLDPGEILGLVGDNSAGKSTLMKIMTGAYSRDSGDILVAGKPVHFKLVAEDDAGDPGHREQDGQGLPLVGVGVGGRGGQQPAQAAEREDDREPRPGGAHEKRNRGGGRGRPEDEQVADEGPQRQVQPVVDPGELDRPPE